MRFNIQNLGTKHVLYEVKIQQKLYLRVFFKTVFDVQRIRYEMLKGHQCRVSDPCKFVTATDPLIRNEFGSGSRAIFFRLILSIRTGNDLLLSITNYRKIRISILKLHRFIYLLQNLKYFGIFVFLIRAISLTITVYKLLKRNFLPSSHEKN